MSESWLPLAASCNFSTARLPRGRNPQRIAIGRERRKQRQCGWEEERESASLYAVTLVGFMRGCCYRKILHSGYHFPKIVFRDDGLHVALLCIHQCTRQEDKRHKRHDDGHRCRISPFRSLPGGGKRDPTVYFEVEETQGFLRLGNSFCTICSLFNLFCSKIVLLFYSASHFP